jgi:3-hydroxybutyryl-CoA dehydrogenase
MGHGIAQVAALAGCDVVLHDVTAELAEAGIAKVRASLDAGVARGKVAADARDGALSRLRASADLAGAAADADLVVEAAPERMEVKTGIFHRLGAICREDALLATNTSSLSVSTIAEAAARPERVVGLHFFNPPHVMKLVEVVRGRRTSDDAVAAAVAVARRFGKEAIVVGDSPGFATSRLGLALGLEAMRMLEEGVASAEDIDRAMELGYGHPMGPLRTSDLVGLDVRLAIAETLHRELGGDRFKPPDLLREKVRAGKLGKKTGEGFHPWPRKD